MAKKQFRVAELFAGVGGFRLGLEGVPEKIWEGGHTPIKFHKNGTGFRIVFANQWEPSTHGQHAADVYKIRWNLMPSDKPNVYESKDGDILANIDIHEFTKSEDRIDDIPDFDVLVGGFPCQDYSVARTTSGELGIDGKKGKLWEEIKHIVGRMNKKTTGSKERPKLIFLENVPRLLNSPKGRRGLNFHTIVTDLLGLGYDVEWRVINAADYSMPQQRKRVFIIAYRGPNSGSGPNNVNGTTRFGVKQRTEKKIEWWLFGNPEVKINGYESGPFAKTFRAGGEFIHRGVFEENLDAYTDKRAPFGDCGYAWKAKLGDKRLVNQYMSWKLKPAFEVKKTLGSILINKRHSAYDVSYEIEKEKLEEWEYTKSEKKEFRIRKSGRHEVSEGVWRDYRKCIESQDSAVWDEHRSIFEEYVVEGSAVYPYNEGKIAFPDLDSRPSRTIITAEIGKTPSRMRHIIKKNGTWRRLFPIETERLNQFPDDWTKIDGISDSRRGFLMGNALVVGIIQRLRDPLYELLNSRDS